jgi:hypothetical protein
MSVTRPTTPTQPKKTNSPSNAHPRLERMTKEDNTALLHHPGTTLPPFRPSNHPNGSNMKSSWMPEAEELHQITGCCCFLNYRHNTSASKDRHLIDTGEFPISLSSYTTIPKAPRGKAID